MLSEVRAYEAPVVSEEFVLPVLVVHAVFLGQHCLQEVVGGVFVEWVLHFGGVVLRNVHKLQFWGERRQVNCD